MASKLLFPVAVIYGKIQKTILDMQTITIGIFGFGVVGKGTVAVLTKGAREIALRTGLKVHIKRICDRSMPQKNDFNLPRETFTANPDDLLNDPEITLVVELIGGTNVAKTFIKKALKKGKHVVTANKYLLALHGEELFALAKKNDVMLLAEASVCGAIPCLRFLRKSTPALRVSKIKAVLNGTANFILSKLQNDGGTFPETLKEAQKLGYAEADPTFDVEGIDSAHKLAVLAAFAFGAKINFSAVKTKGISSLIPDDFYFAAELGYRIKLVGSAERKANEIFLSIMPTLVKKYSKLGQINGVMNAVLFDSDLSGQILLEGHGAGGAATGTAVVADIMEIAKWCSHGAVGQSLPFQKTVAYKFSDPSDLLKKTVLRVVVDNKPGVLAAIAKLLAEEGISILGVSQKPSTEKVVALSLFLDKVPLKKVEKVAEKAAKLPFAKSKSIVIPIDEDE